MFTFVSVFFVVLYQSIQQNSRMEFYSSLLLFVFKKNCIRVFARLDDQRLVGEWMTWIQNYSEITNIPIATTTTTITTLAIIPIYAKTPSVIIKIELTILTIKSMRCFRCEYQLKDRPVIQPNKQTKAKRKQKQNGMTKMYIDYNIFVIITFWKTEAIWILALCTYVLITHCSLFTPFNFVQYKKNAILWQFHIFPYFIRNAKRMHVKEWW